MESGKQDLEKDDTNQVGNGQKPTGNTGSDSTVPASDQNGPTTHPEEQPTESKDENKNEQPFHDIKGVAESGDKALDAQAKKEEKGGYGNMQNPRDTDI